MKRGRIFRPNKKREWYSVKVFRPESTFHALLQLLKRRDRRQPVCFSVARITQQLHAIETIFLPEKVAVVFVVNMLATFLTSHTPTLISAPNKLPNFLPGIGR